MPPSTASTTSAALRTSTGMCSSTRSGSDAGGLDSGSGGSVDWKAAVSLMWAVVGVGVVQRSGERVGPDRAGPIPRIAAFELARRARQATGPRYRLERAFGRHVLVNARNVHRALVVDEAVAGVG